MRSELVRAYNGVSNGKKALLSVFCVEKLVSWDRNKFLFSSR